MDYKMSATQVQSYQKMKILMLAETEYPGDTRVRQEAELLQSNGYKVSVVALQKKNQPFYETLNGIRLYRIPRIQFFKNSKQTDGGNTQQSKGRINTILKGVIGYGFEYGYFTFLCFIISIILLFKNRFDVIHTHNPPDTLFVVALFHKLFKTKFVYDHHDLSPDLFKEKYKSGASIVYRLLLFFEKVSCRAADVVIATNESYKQIEINRCNVNPDQIFVVRNGPDLKKMRRMTPVDCFRRNNPTVICYLGAINNQDGLDYLIEAFSLVIYTHKRQDCRLLIVGDGDYIEQIKWLAKKLKVDPFIMFTGYISDIEMLNRYLSSADIFVDSAPKSFLNDNSTFIKHMEYMVFEKPVVSFELKESMYSLGQAGIFVKPNDTMLFSQALLDLVDNPEKREEIGKYGRERLKELSWDKVSQNLLKAYQYLEEPKVGDFPKK